MAKIYKHTTIFPAIIKSTAKGPLDNRQVVATKADLLLINTFEDAAYNGMLVVTEDTGTLYILKDVENISASDYSAWVEISTAGGTAAAATELQLADGSSVYLNLSQTTAADGHKIYTVGVKAVDLVDATESNTGVADAYDVKVALDTEKAIREENEEITAASLNSLDQRVAAVEAVSADYTVDIEESAGTGDIAKVYTFSQLGETIGTVNIPKDLVIQEGKVINVVWDMEKQEFFNDTEDPEHEHPLVDWSEGAGKFLKLIIANKENPIYIKVTDLVDLYYGGSTANLIVSISDANVITTDIVAGSPLAQTITKVAGIEEGAQVNKIEVVKVNGEALDITNKAVNIDLSEFATVEDLVDDEEVVAAALNELDGRVKAIEDIDPEHNVQSDWAETDTDSAAFIKNKPENLVQDANYVHTDNNYTTAEKSKLAGIAEGAQVNVLEGVQLNGVDITIDANKKANVVVDLTPYETKVDAQEEYDAINARIDDNEEVTAAALNDLSERIDEESQASEDISAALTQEIADRIADVNAEETRATTAEGTLDSRITSEVATLTASIAEVDEKADDAMEEAQAKVAGVTVDGTSVVTNHIAALVTKNSNYSAANGLITAEDIKDLAGAMHFRGVINTTGGVNIVAAIKAKYDDLEIETALSGDVFVNQEDGKEWVVKSEVAVVDLTANDIEEFGSVDPSTSVTSFAGETGDITLEANASSVQLAMSGKQLQASIKDGSIANSKLATVATEIADEESTAIATEGIVKTYVDDQIADLTEKVIDDELVVASSLNELNSRVDAVEAAPAVADADYVHTDNNYTTAEKSKLENIAAGAQVNVIESVKVNGTALEITDKAVNVDLSAYETIAAATTAHETINARIDDNEEVTAAALTNLDNRVKELEAKSPEENVQSDWAQTDTTADDYIKNKPYIVNHYLLEVTSGTSVTIPESDHKCGAFPIVQVYFNDELVNGDVTLINNHEDVVVDWANTLTPSAGNPVVIRIIG